MSEKNATLTLTREDGSQQTIDLAVRAGTLGPDVVDVGTLTANGYFTYDPRLYLHRGVRVKNHVYRRRKRRFAAPRVPDRAAGSSTQTT